MIGGKIAAKPGDSRDHLGRLPHPTDEKHADKTERAPSTQHPADYSEPQDPLAPSCPQVLSSPASCPAPLSVGPSCPSYGFRE